MPSLHRRLARTVRDHAATQTLVAAGLLVVFLRVVAAEPWAIIGQFLALLLALSAVSASAKHPRVDNRALAVVFGVVVAAVGLLAPSLVVEGDTLSLTVVAVAAGGWFVIDGIAAYRSGRTSSSETGEFADIDSMETGDVFFEMQLVHLVASQLRERPQTRTELARACDLTESRVQTALDRLVLTDSIYTTEGSSDGETRWAFDESSVGARAFVDTTVGSAVRRVALPFVELSR